MADKSRIEWTDATWNPAKGCAPVSPGCDNCYAKALTRRLRGMQQENYLDGFAVRELPHMLEVPFRWKKPRHIFVVSMGDLFHDTISDAYIAAVFGAMAACPQHTFQVLTKRPERAQRWFDQGWEAVECAEQLKSRVSPNLNIHCNLRWPARNVWLGVSVEDEIRAKERIPPLLTLPAALRFVSCEPLLGPVYIDRLDRLDWVICGGESGPGARPMHPDWARSLRAQCAQTSIPFWFKQWGEWRPATYVKSTTFPDGTKAKVRKVGKRNAGCLLDGEAYQDRPY